MRLGPHDVPLIDVANDWADRVLKLKRDMAGNAPRHLVWTIDDLWASCSVRESIRRALTNKFDATAKLSILEAADDLFRSYTRQMSSREVASIYENDEPPLSDAWWWHRIPIEGPLSDEAARAMARHRQPHSSRTAGSGNQM